MSENNLRGFDETPVILFGGNPKYRLVLCKGRLTLEWQDYDAAGQVRWVNVESWKPSTEYAREHEKIAFEVLLDDWRKMRDEFEALKTLYDQFADLSMRGRLTNFDLSDGGLQDDLDKAGDVLAKARGEK